MDSLQIEQVALDEIVPDERNPRKEHDVEGIAHSINDHGMVQPLVINRRTGKLVIGHGRLYALQRLQPESVPAIFIDISDEQALALMIADNRAGEQAEWDLDQLVSNLQSLQDAEAGYTGFDTGDLEQLELEISKPGQTILEDPGGNGGDPKASRVQRGEIWKLGRHRLMCGDAKRMDDVAALIVRPARSIITAAPSPEEGPPEQEPDENGELPAPTLVLTDPPYNVDYGPTSSGRDSPDVESMPNDNLPGPEFEAFLTECLKHAMLVCERPTVYICMGTAGISTLEAALRKAGIHLSCWIIWNKLRLVLTRRDYHSQYEPVAYGWKAGTEHLSTSDRTQTDIWDIPSPAGDERPDHPTPKPVELFARAMRNSTAPNAAVYDPFVGSGTVFIAAEQEGRTAYGMEIDAKYCETAIARWEQATGQVAEREG
jgi:DNA modification methylase